MSWKRRGVLLAFVVGSIGAGSVLLRWEPDDRDPLTREIDDIVEQAMEAGPIAGVSVVVTRGWRVLHSQGYGYADVENQIPVTPETVFKVGSITKQFTAAAVMQQVEEGRIELDAPITRYLADYEGVDHLSGITVEQLLNHTSGVADYTMIEASWRVLGIDMTPRQVLGYFSEEPLDFTPGARFSYSNSGYVLLGLILESVTGRPYGGLLNEAIFVPEGLEHTAYCDDRRLIPNRAAGYDVVEDGFIHARYVSMSQVYSAGAICSSAIDLVRWMRVLSRGDIIDQTSYERMSTPSGLNDGSRIEYGYGLAVGYVDGHHRVSHVGGFLGFMGQIAHYRDDDVSIVVLTNTDGAAAAQIEGEIARVVIDLGARELLDIELPTEELERFSGRYDVGPTNVDLLVTEGRLHADVRVPRLAGRYRLLYQGDATFASETDAEVRVTFDFDEEDQVTGFILRNRGIVMEGARIN